MRQLLCLLLMLSLHLQALAWQGRPPLLGGDTHQLAHVSDVHHHHEADGSVHYDDSDESADHLHDSSTSAQPASLTVPLLAVSSPSLVSALTADVQRFIPAPFLDGPHRPPARTLG